MGLTSSHSVWVHIVAAIDDTPLSEEPINEDQPEEPTPIEETDRLKEAYGSLDEKAGSLGWFALLALGLLARVRRRQA